MKKLWMLPVLLLAAVACSDDNGGDDVPPPSADQHVTCEISAPADGAEVDMSAKMTIEGDAEIDAGKISKVTLTVGGKVVSDVTSVPFTYGEFYQFNLSSCIRQQNSLTAQFVSFSLSNLANIFYPPPIFTIINLCLL